MLGIKAEKDFELNPFHLKRRAGYYFFNLLIPSGLIGFLAILGFTSPPESGEKLPLGATMLFSLIAFLNMISESMPANSDAVPLLGMSSFIIQSDRSLRSREIKFSLNRNLLQLYHVLDCFVRCFHNRRQYQYESH